MNSSKKLLQFNFDSESFEQRAPKSWSIPSETLAVLERIHNEHNNVSLINNSTGISQKLC